MRSRADEIRKRMAKRRRERERHLQKAEQFPLVSDEEKYGFDKMPSYEGGPEEDHPLFRKEVFLFKLLASACLVLIVAIIFQNDGKYADRFKTVVTNALEQDFQFAAVSDWYENYFGKPLALLPFSNDADKKSPGGEEPEFAVPATGRILKDFEVNGQSITVETEKGENVAAMKEGIVRFIGEKEGFGNTVIIQHSDKSESWYGNLESVQPELYQFVEKGSVVGTASDTADGTKGSFNFAIKKGEDFIDPIQVIRFE